MHKQNRLTLLLALALALAACAPASPESGDSPLGPEPIPSEEPINAPSHNSSQPPDIAESIRARLATELSLSPDQITLQEFQAVDWPDSCLGVTEKGVLCAEVITPGYRFIFFTPNGEYEVRSDLNGLNTRTLPATKESPSGQSGIQGQVLIGPTCGGPIRVGATECADKPYQATLTILDANGLQVTQIQTDAEGRFQISLPPGTYTLRPESDTPLPYAPEQVITVLEGHFTQVTITYDSGLR